jgi:hypothetical protein
MTIVVTRLPEFGVNMSVYSGPITRAELIEHYSTIDAEDAACAERWISYFDRTADLSQLDVAAIGELRRLTAAKLRGVYGDRILTVAIVCKSRVNEPILAVWRNYLAADTSHPSNVHLFLSLKEACDWLDLPGAAAFALAAIAGEIRVDEPRPATRTISPD